MAEIAFMVFSLGLLMDKKARPSFVYLSLQSMKGRKISKGSLSDFLDSISFQMSESQFKKSLIYRRHIIQLNKVLILSLLCTRFRIGGIKAMSRGTSDLGQTSNYSIDEPNSHLGRPKLSEDHLLGQTSNLERVKPINRSSPKSNCNKFSPD